MNSYTHHTISCMFIHMQSFPHTKVRFLKMDNVLRKVHSLLVSDFTRALPKDNCMLTRWSSCIYSSKGIAQPNCIIWIDSELISITNLIPSWSFKCGPCTTNHLSNHYISSQVSSVKKVTDFFSLQGEGRFPSELESGKSFWRGTELQGRAEMA